MRFLLITPFFFALNLCAQQQNGLSILGTYSADIAEPMQWFHDPNTGESMEVIGELPKIYTVVIKDSGYAEHRFVDEGIPNDSNNQTYYGYWTIYNDTTLKVVYDCKLIGDSIKALEESWNRTYNHSQKGMLKSPGMNLRWE